MEKLSQGNLLSLTFSNMLGREELLSAKCLEYSSKVNNLELKDMFEEYKTLAQEHIKIMQGKMLKLNIEQ